MSAAIGISIGSESCVVAASTALGRCEVFANDAGDRCTPTYVAVVAGELLVGGAAKQAYVRYPMQTVPHVLPLTSPSVVNANQFRVRLDMEVREADDKVVFLNLDADDEETVHEANELAISFLSRFKASVVDGAVGETPIGSVVLAVPRYLDTSTCVSLLRSAGFAGTLQCIHSDVAALLAYGVQEARTALVIDWGSSTLSMSVLRLEGGLVSTVAHKIKYSCGGKLIDVVIQDQMAEAFRRKTKMDPRENARSMRKLLLNADERKKTLSSANTTNLEIEAFCEGIDLNEPLSRVKLEMMIRETTLLTSFERLLEELLDEAAPEDGASQPLLLSHALFSGGCLRIPFIQQYVRTVLAKQTSGKFAAFFPSSPLAVLDSIASDEVTAVGSCQEAVALNGPAKGALSESELSQVRSVTSLNATIAVAVAPLSESQDESGSIACEASQLVPVFARGAPVPSSVEIVLGEPLAQAASLLLVAQPSSMTTSCVPLMTQPLTVEKGVDRLVIIVSEGEKECGQVDVFAHGPNVKSSRLTKEAPIIVTVVE